MVVCFMVYFVSFIKPPVRNEYIEGNLLLTNNENEMLTINVITRIAIPLYS